MSTFAFKCKPSRVRLYKKTKLVYLYVVPIPPSYLCLLPHLTFLSFSIQNSLVCSSSFFSFPFPFFSLVHRYNVTSFCRLASDSFSCCMTVVLLYIYTLKSGKYRGVYVFVGIPFTSL